MYECIVMSVREKIPQLARLTPLQIFTRPASTQYNLKFGEELPPVTTIFRICHGNALIFPAVKHNHPKLTKIDISFGISG